jgi:arginyl-tRNA synthetase
MCKAFNRFYSDVPVLKAESEDTIRMRLSLILAFALTLKQGLALIGITPPERM